MVESDLRARGREILNGLRGRADALHQAFGEIGGDIMKGHLAHLRNKDVVEILTLIGLSRSNSLGTRFFAGRELTREPEEILRILISSPNTYNRHARQLKFSDVEQAVGEGRLAVDYSAQIDAARKNRAAEIKTDIAPPLELIAS